MLIPSSELVFAEHIFETNTIFAEYLDIAMLSGEKYTIEIEENSFDIYYGYGGSLEVDIEELKETQYPLVSSMILNQERKSVQVNFDKVQHEIVMWIRLPIELISAEEANYQILIDEVETQYDVTKYPGMYALGVILPENAQQIEIIGTKVIPEFGTLAILVLVSGIGLMVLAQRKNLMLLKQI